MCGAPSAALRSAINAGSSSQTIDRQILSKLQKSSVGSIATVAPSVR
jgi:hypothetical protein